MTPPVPSRADSVPSRADSQPAGRRPVRLIELGPVSPARSQAVYHAVAERMEPGSPDTVILTSPDAPYLCLGYHQPFDAVLERATCAGRGLPVLRRRVGGGATYLDANQLFYQFVFHHTRVPANFRKTYAYLLAAPVATLRRLGLEGEISDVNEVEVGARRIAGIGGGRVGEACVVVGNFLFDFDFETMAAVWRVPSAGFRALAARALPECVVTLRELLGGQDKSAGKKAGKNVGENAYENINEKIVRELLIQELALALGRPLEPGGLSSAEWEYVREVEQRLGSDSFLNLHGENGARPMRTLKISSRGHIHAVELENRGEPIRASLYARDGVIVAANLEGRPPRDAKGLEASLLGAPISSVQVHP